MQEACAHQYQQLSYRSLHPWDRHCGCPQGKGLQQILPRAGGSTAKAVCAQPQLCKHKVTGRIIKLFSSHMKCRNIYKIFSGCLQIPHTGTVRQRIVLSL